MEDNCFKTNNNPESIPIPEFILIQEYVIIQSNKYYNLYFRYTQPPGDLWDWYESFLDDEEVILFFCRLNKLSN